MLSRVASHSIYTFVTHYQLLAASRAAELNLSAYAIAKRSGGKLHRSMVQRFLAGKCDLLGDNLNALFSALKLGVWPIEPASTNEPQTNGDSDEQ